MEIDNPVQPISTAMETETPKPANSLDKLITVLEQETIGWD